MFQLDTAITNWRNSLLSNQNITDGNADELESHLRDEIDSLMLSGLTEEEGFMISTHRIGDHREVGQEFAKVNPSLAWRRRAFWMFFGILVSMLVSGIASLCSNGSAVLLTWLNVDAYISGVASVAVYIGVFMMIMFSVIFGLSVFTKAMKNRLSVSMTLILCMLSIVILKAAAIAFNVLRVRLLDIETVGKMALASSYINMAWSVLWPAIVGVMLFVLWSSRPQRVR